MKKHAQIALDFGLESVPATSKLAVDKPVARKEPQEVQVNKTPVDIPDAISVVKKSASPNSRTSTRGRRKISELEKTVELVEVPDDETLFSRQYYSIGKVAEMFKVNVSLVRFWENEFDVLKPKKNGKGDRLFRPEDVKNLKIIHQLLREKKFTIEGAKDFIKKNRQLEENFALIEQLKKLKLFLTELKLSL